MIGITAVKPFKKRLTTRMGEVEYTNQDVFFFENGIYGFEDLKGFVIIPLPSENVPEFYRYFQSVEEPDLSLIIMNVVFSSKGEGIIKVKDLAVHFEKRNLKPSDVSIYLVTSIHNQDGKQRISVNTKAPIILCPGHQKGWQVVLDNDAYLVKHYLV